jgi:hypothetical protein
VAAGQLGARRGLAYPPQLVDGAGVTGKGGSAYNGNSVAAGNVMPSWMQHSWEMQELWPTRYSFWTEQA